MFKVGDLVLYGGTDSLCLVVATTTEDYPKIVGLIYEIIHVADPHHPFRVYEDEIIHATKESVSGSCRVWK